MTGKHLTTPLNLARLPGRILSMQAEIGDTLADLCKMTAYDLSRLKGVGDNVIDDTRAVLAFYGLALSGDPVAEIVEGAEHPIIASYRGRLEAKYPGMAAKLGTLSDREVGEEFGVSAQSVNNHRRMLDIDKAVRTRKQGKKDALITLLKSAIADALEALAAQDGTLAIAILTASLADPEDDDSDEDDDDADDSDDDNDDDEDEDEDEDDDDDDDDDEDDDSDDDDASDDASEATEQAASPTPSTPPGDGVSTGTFNFEDEFDGEDNDSAQPGGLTFS